MDLTVACPSLTGFLAKIIVLLLHPKKKVKKLFAKKLRSTKAIRGAALEDEYTKRFQSQEQKISFIKLYKKAQTRRKSVAGVFKPTAVFPQSI